MQRFASIACAAAALLFGAACSNLPAGTNAQQADVRFTSRVHKMARHASNPTPGASGANLQYYGGHVIPNARIVQVLFGSGTYAPEVSGSQMGSFYTEVTNSTFMDWLSEYNTNITAVGGQPGTNQTIGRGTFAGRIQITPSTSGSTIDDSAIQSEIAAQINAGTLPAPDANTLYMINFPHGLAITQGGSPSCASGGFCAYHGTFTRNGASVYYGVLPDMSAGSGCDTGCGSDPSPFNNQTSVASHEFIEAVTDAEVGLATGNGPPLAWYDQTNGEIGDICNAQQGTFVGSDGVTYVVQQEWSNAQQACVDHGANSTPPPAGCSTDADCSNGQVCVSGTCQNPKPPPPPPPSGCSTDADCSNGQVCVSGTCQDPAPPPPTGTVVTNGDFEAGDLSGWKSTGVALARSPGHAGSYSAQVGDVNPGGDSSLQQSIVVPGGNPQLSFWYQVNCADSVDFDWAAVTILDASGAVLATPLGNNCSNDGTWRSATFDLTPYAGQNIVLSFNNHDDGNPGDPTFTLYDDVSVQ